MKSQAQNGGICLLAPHVHAVKETKDSYLDFMIGKAAPQRVKFSGGVTEVEKLQT